MATVSPDNDKKSDAETALLQASNVMLIASLKTLRLHLTLKERLSTVR
jgi:hypothetical protein